MTDPAESVIQRRKVPRAKANIVATLQSDKGEHAVTVAEIGVGGARLEFGGFLQPDVDYRLILVLDANEDPLRCLCHIVWTNDHRDGTYSFGIEFDSLSVEQSMMIIAFVDSQSDELLSFF